MATITKRQNQVAGAYTPVEYPDHNHNIQSEIQCQTVAREIENQIECGNIGAVAKPTKETLGEVLEKYLHQRRNPQRLRK